MRITRDRVMLTCSMLGRFDRRDDTLVYQMLSGPEGVLKELYVRTSYVHFLGLVVNHA